LPLVFALVTLCVIVCGVPWPTFVGQALDSAVANFFAGQGTPQTITQSVTNANTSGK